jgi:molybdate transport repressor ModE-like protein
MRLVPALAWKLDGEPGEPLDGRLVALLEAIAASGSLAAAVADRGISYRAAWGLLRDYERKLGVPLVRLEPGRGATLTSPGERLIGRHKAALARLARILPGLAFDIGTRGPKADRSPLLTLRVDASHDLALAALANAPPAETGLELELSFMGSLTALAAFDAGRVGVAGFHLPIARRADSVRAPFLRWLQPQRDRLIRVVDRDQGLILPPGNPAAVQCFKDLAEKGLRFVNRQRGSGTRLLIEQMIADADIEPSDLDGYGREEFTHPAVAATVASGGADAGFGLRAAAAEYRLAFVPLVRERYFLAVRAKDVETAAIARLIDALRSPLFTQIVRRLPGYRSTAAGTLAGLEALVAGRPAHPSPARPGRARTR